MESAASSMGDPRAGDAGDPAGVTDKWEAGTNQMRLQILWALGLIPFRQTLLTGVIYLFQNLLANKKEEEFIANIYTGRINGGEQPSLWHYCKYVRPAFFPLLPSYILPSSGLTALSSDPAEVKGEPGPSTLWSLEAICSRNCKIQRSCPYKLFTGGGKRSRELLGFLAKPLTFMELFPCPYQVSLKVSVVVLGGLWQGLMAASICKDLIRPAGLKFANM